MHGALGARTAASLALVVVLVVLVAVAAVPCAAQGTAPPRTSWGEPDLGGTWDFLTLTPLERPEEFADQAVLTEEEAANFVAQRAERSRAARRSRPGGDVGTEAWVAGLGAQLTDDRRTSLIVDPVDGKIPPFQPEAQRYFDARQEVKTRPVRERVAYGPLAHGPEDLGLAERCILGFNTGPPLSGTGYNTKLLIVQRADYVVLFSEMIHEVRIVPLGGRPHLSPGIRQWLGDPRGHWDGETLVVTSTNFNDKVASFNPSFWKAVGSGETLHLTERFTRVDVDTLHYEFTVDDSATFTRSFTGRIPLQKTEESMFEYACHEGNYSMFNVLSGARAEERAQGPTDSVPLP